MATLQGPAAQQLVGAKGAGVVLEDSSGSLKMTLGNRALEQRTSQLLDGAQVAVTPNLPSEYRFTHVRFAWSHDDDDYWVSEWSDGFHGSRDENFSAFNLLPSQNPGEHVFSVRGDAALGGRTVYFGARASEDACEFKSCRGIEHVTKTEVTLVAP